MLGISRRFVLVDLVAAIEGDAGTARVNQFGDPVPLATCDDVFGAPCIRLVVILPFAPNTGDRGGVEDDVHPLAGCLNLIRIANVASSDHEDSRFKRLQPDRSSATHSEYPND